jgi:hypothetical protein
MSEKPQARQKRLDTRVGAIGVLSNRGVREGVSFWCAFGVPSRAVRLVARGRTGVFENSLVARCHRRAIIGGVNEHARRNLLSVQAFTSEWWSVKKSLHPSGDPFGVVRRWFAVVRNRSTPLVGNIWSRRRGQVHVFGQRFLQVAESCSPKNGPDPRPYSPPAPSA